MRSVRWARWWAKIKAEVERNWRRPPNTSAGLTVIIQVEVARNGTVISARIAKSSGNEAFDKSAEIAVNFASPLPFPDNPEYYQYINKFNFKFSPDG